MMRNIIRLKIDHQARAWRAYAKPERVEDSKTILRMISVIEFMVNEAQDGVIDRKNKRTPKDEVRYLKQAFQAQLEFVRTSFSDQAERAHR